MPKKTSIQKRRKTVPGSKSQGTRKTSSSAQTTRPTAKAKSRKSAPTDTTLQPKKMEDGYPLNENKIRLITDYLPVLISYIDREQRFRFNNELYEKWFGHPRSFFYGKHVKEVLGDKVYERIQKHFEKALSGQKVIHETLMPYKYGETRYVHAEFTPDFGEQGEVIGFYALIADISEQKEAEKLLKKSQAETASIIKNAVDPLITIDELGMIEVFNPAAARTFGYSASEVIGKNVKMLMPEHYHSEHDGYLDNYNKTGEAKVIGIGREVVGQRKDGSTFPLDLAINEMEVEGDRRFVGICRDITERKRMQQELEEANEKLEQRVRERTKELHQRNRQLKNLLAHLENVREEEKVHIAREVHDELGQILTAFKFDLSELEELIPPDSKGIGNLVKKLIKDADTTLESVQRILTQLRPQVLDIFGVGPAFEWQANEFQNQTGITCEVNHFPENLQIEKDKSLILFRILQEALWNVRHHAQASQVQINFRVNDENLIMEIKDNGVGMKPENVNDPQSFGILGIQERADLLGGTASFRSNPGEGTTVSIQLPK